MLEMAGFLIRSVKMKTSVCVPSGHRVPKTTGQFDDGLEGLTNLRRPVTLWVSVSCSGRMRRKPTEDNGAQGRAQA